MRPTGLRAILAFVWICQARVPFAQRSAQDVILHRVADCYWNCTWSKRPFKELPVVQARRLRRQRGLSQMRIAALDAYCALYSHGKAGYVRALVHEAYGNGHNFGGDAVMSLGPNLTVIFERTGSSLALRYLITLPMDGAPAEEQSGCIYDLSLEKPALMAHYFKSRYRTISGFERSLHKDHLDPVLEMFYMERDDPQEWSVLVRKVQKAPGRDARFFGEMLEHVPLDQTSGSVK